VIEAAVDAGITVLGYVDTGYFGTTGHQTRLGATDPDAWLAQAQQDVNAWYELYGDLGLGGIFFDQVTNQCGTDNDLVSRTALLSAYTKEVNIDALSVTNQGTGMEECYRDTADILLSFEGDLATYREWTAPAWTLEEDPDKFWHLVYDTKTTAELAEAVALSKQRQAGYLYVTPGLMPNPWNMLPDDTYWKKQIELLEPYRRDRVPPEAPDGLHWVDRTSTTITLAWDLVPARHGVVAYDVYDDGLRVATASRANPTAVVRNLEADSPHEFTVRARDGAGNVSAETDVLRVSTRDSDRRRPLAPTGLSGIASTPTSVWLTWVGAVDPDGEVAGYEVYQNGKRILRLPATTVSIAVSGLAPATAYEYYVVTRDASGNGSVPSTKINLTTPEAPPPPGQ
jgi:chitodextrinase